MTSDAPFVPKIVLIPPERVFVIFEENCAFFEKIAWWKNFQYPLYSKKGYIHFCRKTSLYLQKWSFPEKWVFTVFSKYCVFRTVVSMYLLLHSSSRTSFYLFYGVYWLRLDLLLFLIFQYKGMKFRHLRISAGEYFIQKAKFSRPVNEKFPNPWLNECWIMNTYYFERTFGVGGTVFRAFL